MASNAENGSIWLRLHDVSTEKQDIDTNKYHDNSPFNALVNETECISCNDIWHVIKWTIGNKCRSSFFNSCFRHYVYVLRVWKPLYFVSSFYSRDTTRSRIQNQNKNRHKTTCISERQFISHTFCSAGVYDLHILCNGYCNYLFTNNQLNWPEQLVPGQSGDHSRGSASIIHTCGHGNTQSLNDLQRYCISYQLSSYA